MFVVRYLRKSNNPLIIRNSAWFLFHFLFSLHILLPVVVFGQNALKVCTKDGHVHQMRTETCARGVWAGDALDVDCVCLRGLWLLSDKFCSKEFAIFSGRENDCYKVNGPIRRFLSLVDNNDLKYEQNYYFRSALQSFQTFEGNLSIPSKSIPGAGDKAFLIRYNETKNALYVRHEEGVPSKFWQKCYEPSKSDEQFQIIETDGASFLSTSRERNCEASRDLKFGYGNTKNTVWNMDMRSGWHSKYGPTKLSKQCQKSCGQKTAETARSGSGNKKFNKNKTLTQSSNMDKGIYDNTLTGDDERIQSSLGDEEKEYDHEYDENGSLLGEDDSLDVDVMAERLQDNGRDTMRMTNYLKKWIFHNIPGPRVAQIEFQYLQLARIVFLKSCPDVDGQTLTNFFRLFRFLVYESLSKHPETYPENTEDAIHTRIVTTMRKCFKNVTPYKVILDMGSCPEGTEKPLKTYNSLVKAISVTDSKGITYSPEINATDDVTFRTDDVTFKTGLNSDTVLETAWKLILHAHYQCAEEFIDHPEDLSWMYIKLQEFLTNPRILFRWENPGEYLNKVYAFMHPGFNLDKFAKTVDACVSAAKESSLFEEWMQRPTRQRDFESGIGKATLFGGKGDCVNKFDDPITHFNAKCH